MLPWGGITLSGDQPNKLVISAHSLHSIIREHRKGVPPPPLVLDCYGGGGTEKLPPKRGQIEVDS